MVPGNAQGASAPFTHSDVIYDPRREGGCKTLKNVCGETEERGVWQKLRVDAERVPAVAPSGSPSPPGGKGVGVSRLSNGACTTGRKPGGQVHPTQRRLGERGHSLDTEDSTGAQLWPQAR